MFSVVTTLTAKVLRRGERHEAATSKRHGGLEAAALRRVRNDAEIGSKRDLKRYAER